jgi:photosystem II stability/assembly factor-like uncharacterized protein
VDLHGAACIKGNVFAVGDKGTILIKSALGSAFVDQKSGLSADLYAVSFASTSAGDTHGVAVGKSFQLFQTDDLGKKWEIAPQCLAVVLDAIYAVHLETVSNGFAVGYEIKTTSSAMKYSYGSSWYCSDLQKGVTFYGVFRIGHLGWAVGETGGQIHVFDETVTYPSNPWKTYKLPVSTTLRAITFAGKSLGLAVGDKGTILRSVDGKGQVWKQVTSPVTATLRAVAMRGSSLAWAVGDKGTVLHSSDGGKTWAQQRTAAAVDLEGLCLTSDHSGWAVGKAGTVLYTTTGGK